MMVDGRHMTGLVMHPQHLARIWQQWALATRVHPVDRAVHFEDGPILPLLTCYSPEERHATRATKVVREALLPAPDRRDPLSDFTHAYPAAVRAKVLARHHA